METADRATGNTRLVDDEGTGILVDVDTGLLRITPSSSARTFVFVVILNNTITNLLFITLW